LLNPVEEILRRRVRELRTLNGFTQSQLAEKVGVANETISRMETGKAMPSLRTIARLADVLQIDFVDLFRFRRDPSAHEAAIDRLRWLLRRRTVAEVEFVIDLVTLIFEQARMQMPIESKREQRL
jgi:transcriptional regulator with XRE-family HTH domain